MTQNLTNYSSNSKLQVIKAPKYLAGAFGHENVLARYTLKMVFVLLIENFWEIWESKVSSVMENYENNVFRKCLRNFTENGRNIFRKKN